MRQVGLAALAAAMVLAGCEVREAPSAPMAEGNAPAPAPENVASAAAGTATPEASEKPVAIAAAAADLKWAVCPPGMPEGCQLAVLHGDPAKPDADIFLRVPGGSTIAPHWHSSSERIMLVSGRLAVKYLGAAEALLEPGNYAYGPAGLPHRATCQSSEPCTLFIAFDKPVDRYPYAGEI